MEDHGCIISFGVKDFTGFVLKEKLGEKKNPIYSEST